MKHLKLLESWEAPRSRKEIAEICYNYSIENWYIDDEGLVSIDGNLNLSALHIISNVNRMFRSNLKRLPLNFGTVRGFFNCSQLGLTTLQGAPHTVEGDFICSLNKIKTLKYSPKQVSGNYDCSGNLLERLEGVPAEISGDFECQDNALTTLQGGPKKVSGAFDCNKNRLTDLQGVPKEIGGFFDCSQNRLTSLEGGPVKVRSHYFCAGNWLRNLKGAPSRIDGVFTAKLNPLTSLEGVPKVIGVSFTFDDYHIKDFSHFPEYIQETKADEWFISRLKEKEIETEYLDTLPYHVLTPRFMSTVRQLSYTLYQKIKANRSSEQQWKTDLSVDLGNLGF